MTARRLAQAIALNRVAVGAALMLAPDRAAAVLVGGRDARRPGARLLARGFGARDLALGAGTVLALREGDSGRRWLLAGALSDAVDCAAIVAAGRAVPSLGRYAFPVVAGGAALAGVALERALTVA